MLDWFRNPPPEYRAVLVWTPSHPPSGPEISRRLIELRSKGFGALLLQADHDTIKTETINEQKYRSQEHARLFTIPVLPLERDGLRSTSGEMAHASVSSAVRTDLDLEADADYVDSRVDAIRKLLISNAHLRGRSRVPALIEMMPQTSLADLKARADWLAAMGANLFCPAITDRVGNYALEPWKQPWWRHFGLLTDYLARLSWMLSQGPHRAQAALLHPINGFIFEHSQGLESNLDRVILEFFDAYCELLRDEHIDFDIITEESLTRACSVDQTLSISGEEYELLIIPPTTCIGVEAARAVREFVDDGGAVIGSVLLPCRDIGNAHSEVRAIFESVFGLDPDDLRSQARTAGWFGEPDLTRPGDRVTFLRVFETVQLSSILRECITSLIRPRVSLRQGGRECRDISFTHRLTHEGELFFFANRSPHPREVRMTIRCGGFPYVLDAETGTVSALPYCTQQGDRNILLYRFEGYGSLLLHFLNEPALLPIREIAEEGVVIQLADEWEFAIEGHNCVPLLDWIPSNEPEIRSLRSYTTAVEVATDVGAINLAVAIKDVELKSIEVNGEELSIGSRWELDISCRCAAIPDKAKGSTLAIRITCHSSTPDPPRAFLFGDFRVGHSGQLLRPFRTVRSGSLSDQGYPRASGLLVYRQMFHLPCLIPGQRTILKVQQPTGPIEFVVNGATAGLRAWPPYQVDITQFVRSGANHVELKVAADISNLYNTKPRPSGLLGGAAVVIV